MQDLKIGSCATLEEGLGACPQKILREFLNQACAGLRLAHACFFEIAFIRKVSMRVCLLVCLCVCPLLITIHMKRSLNNQSNKSVSL